MLGAEIELWLTNNVQHASVESPGDPRSLRRDSSGADVPVLARLDQREETSREPSGRGRHRGEPMPDPQTTHVAAGQTCLSGTKYKEC